MLFRTFKICICCYVSKNVRAENKMCKKLDYWSRRSKVSKQSLLSKLAVLWSSFSSYSSFHQHQTDLFCSRFEGTPEPYDGSSGSVLHSKQHWMAETNHSREKISKKHRWRHIIILLAWFAFSGPVIQFFAHLILSSVIFRHVTTNTYFKSSRDNSSEEILRYRMNSITFEFPARFVRRYLKRDLVWGNESWEVASDNDRDAT